MLWRLIFDGSERLTHTWFVGTCFPSRSVALAIFPNHCNKKYLLDAIHAAIYFRALTECDSGAVRTLREGNVRRSTGQVVLGSVWAIRALWEVEGLSGDMGTPGAR